MNNYSTVFLSAFCALGITAGLTSCATLSGAAVDRERFVEIQSGDVTDELDGYRIVFVSDIHLGSNYTEERMASLVREVNSANCDIIILGGDYTLDATFIEPFGRVAAGFRARDGVYAIAGNHDVWNGKRTTQKALQSAGIVFLDETVVTLQNGIIIAGVGDYRFENPDMASLSEGIPKDAFAILAAHNPDLVEQEEASENLDHFDLVLSGHTHGGQITLFGLALKNASRYGQRYLTGTAEKNGVPVVISNGVGYGTPFTFRFCAPSDFLIVTLRKE